MEFSFSRSNESTPLRNSTQSNGSSAKPETSTQQTSQQTSPQAQAKPSDDGIDTSTITNERLRKAIEKNRARQAERNRTHPQAAPQQQPQYAEQASFFENQSSVNEEEPSSRVPPNKPRAEERVHPASQKTTTVVTRRSAARPNEADFTPVKRTSRKVANQINYAVPNRKKSKNMDPTLVNYLVKGCWIFCVVMILRLIFAQGGVTDFYSQRSLHNDRLTELDRIKKENMQLVREIERMQTDSAFQKKLVRDNLGFIAADEFLVLFPKEKSGQ